MIFVSDARGLRIHVSDEWTKLTGQKAIDSLGTGWLDRVYPDDRSIVNDIYAQAIAEAAEFSVRYRILTSDNTVRWVIAGGIPSFGPPDNGFIGFLGSLVELSPDDPGVIPAYGSIGRLVPSATHMSHPLMDSLDQVADCLILAHRLIQEDGGKNALPSLRQALFEVGIALATRTNQRRVIN